METGTPVAVFVPTCGRAERLAAVNENILSTAGAACMVCFILEADDRASNDAARGTGAKVIVNPGPRTYASCINNAYAMTSQPFFFLSADDVVFVDGWLRDAMSCMADETVGVVGAADLVHPDPDHSTHYLVRRAYIDKYGGCVDRKDVVLYPYWHGWTDWELVITAKIRGAYRYCETANFRHVHPGWNDDGSVRSDHDLFDATYAKGNRRHFEDTMLFAARTKLYRREYLALEPKTRADRHFGKRISWLRILYAAHRLGFGERGIRFLRHCRKVLGRGSALLRRLISGRPQ